MIGQLMIGGLLFAADVSDATGGGMGLSNTDRGVFAVLATAISGVVGWAVKSILPLIKETLENQRRQTETLQSFANSYAVMAWMQQSFVRRFAKTRRCILIIEDDRIASMVVTAVCAALARRTSLALISVPTLQQSYEHIPDAAIVILDVCLPDASKEMVKAFALQCAGMDCPVVIYSEDDYTAADFPSAASIIKKGSSTDAMKREIEAIVTRMRSEMGENTPNQTNQI